MQGLVQDCLSKVNYSVIILRALGNALGIFIYHKPRLVPEVTKADFYCLKNLNTKISQQFMCMLI